MKIIPHAAIRYMEQKIIATGNELIEMKKELEELKMGLEHPQDVYWTFQNCSIDRQIMCAYDGTWFGDDFGYAYFTEPSAKGIQLCHNCAKKFAPYLTQILHPFIDKNRDFYQDMAQQHPHIILPSCESRVPVIMHFLSKAIKMPAFL